MADSWCHVTTRFGGETGESPSDRDVGEAIREVLEEERLNLPVGDLEEHPNVWMECGRDGGALFILDLYRGGRMEFSKYSDVDYSEKLFRAEKEGVTVAEAERLWKSLRDGKFGVVEGAFGV